MRKEFAVEIQYLDHCFAETHEAAIAKIREVIMNEPDLLRFAKWRVWEEGNES